MSKHVCISTHVYGGQKTTFRIGSHLASYDYWRSISGSQVCLQVPLPPYRWAISPESGHQVPRLATAEFSPITSFFSTVSWLGGQPWGLPRQRDAVSSQGRKAVVGGIPQVASPGLLASLQALIWLPGLTGPSPAFHARPWPLRPPPSSPQAWRL